MPLHRPRGGLVGYYQQLSYCVSQYIDKDRAATAPIVVASLLRCWPWCSSTKQIVLLSELEEVLETAGPEPLMVPPPAATAASAAAASEAGEAAAPVAPVGGARGGLASRYATVAAMVGRVLAQCASSPHFQVAERCLLLWNNERLAGAGGLLGRAHADVMLPLLYPALTRVGAADGHWNDTVEALAANVLQLYRAWDPLTYDSVASNAKKLESDHAHLAVTKQARWMAVGEHAKANAAMGAQVAAAQAEARATLAARRDGPAAASAAAARKTSPAASAMAAAAGAPSGVVDPYQRGSPTDGLAAGAAAARARASLGPAPAGGSASTAASLAGGVGSSPPPRILARQQQPTAPGAAASSAVVVVTGGGGGVSSGLAGLLPAGASISAPSSPALTGAGGGGGRRSSSGSASPATLGGSGRPSKGGSPAPSPALDGADASSGGTGLRSGARGARRSSRGGTPGASGSSPTVESPQVPIPVAAAAAPGGGAVRTSLPGGRPSLTKPGGAPPVRGPGPAYVAQVSSPLEPATS